MGRVALALLLGVQHDAADLVGRVHTHPDDDAADRLTVVHDGPPHTGATCDLEELRG